MIQIQHANIDRAKAQQKRLRSMGIESHLISYACIDRRDVLVEDKYKTETIKTKGHGTILTCADNTCSDSI